MGGCPRSTPEGRKRQQAVGRGVSATRWCRPTSAGPLRCVSWGVPRLGGRYGSGDLSYYQIVQAPDHVVLYAETGHEARIIPLDGRPHVNAGLTQWNGDSRGRWDGATLVVETRNFSTKSFFMGAAERLTLVERFTRTGPDAIQYEITITDPTTWTEPWSAMLPLQRRQETAVRVRLPRGQLPPDARHDGRCARAARTRREERSDDLVSTSCWRRRR